MESGLLSVEDSAKIIYKSIRGHWEESFGDVLPRWDDTALKCQIMLCRTVVRLAKLDDISINPEVSHRLWWLDAINDGWLYGDKLDMTDMMHPRNPKMKPWEFLTKDQKVMTDIVTCTFRHIKKDVAIVRKAEKPENSNIYHVKTDIFNNYNGRQ